MKSSQQRWENCLYVCVNLIEKCTLRFKCLTDFCIYIYYFYRREREEEDKTFRENLSSSLILSRARCYEKLYGRELYKDVEKPDCTHATADILGKYK